MHRDRDFRCIAFSRIGGGSAAFSLSAVAGFGCYDRCIEIGDLRCIAFTRIRGGFAACPSQVLVVRSTAMTDA